MIERTSKHAIERALCTFPAVLLTGPRQSGKTTLLREKYGATHRYVSLENPELRERALADPIGFLREHPTPLILDEIQYAPELLSPIKSRIDEARKPGHWLLTGSQSLPLMQGVSQSMAGRVAVLDLLPFSAGEAAGAPSGERSIDDLLDDVFAGGPEARTGASRPPATLGDWLLRGSYPEPRSNPDVDRMLWCASYVQTYLERDVRQILQVGDLNTFHRFLRLAAARTGQILNYSELARDTGISQPTAKQWISVLEASGQVFLLPPYFENFGKRSIKSPKLYFLDTGIASFIMGLHAEAPILQGPFAGALVETAIVSAWVKAFRHRGEPPALYFWRSRDGLEVDIIIERNARLYPMEVKASSTLTPHHADALRKWRQLAGKAVARGVVIAHIEERMSLAPDVHAVPWWAV